MAPLMAGEAPLSRQDLLNLSADLKSHFDSAIDRKLLPISKQLSELASTLKDVSATAETAMELGLTVQEDARLLQGSQQQLLARVAALETQARASNLKLRGLPESPDLNANLASTLASWLASVLKLEDGIAPTILEAFRIGPLSAVRPNFPRDVVLHFLYPRSRNAVLQLARAGGPLKYKEHNIQVLLDLPPEVLAKRRLLKPVTECLHENRIHFRWSTTSDILIYREGRQLRADDIDSGKDLLLALKLRLPPDLSPRSPAPSTSQDEG